MNLLLSVSQKIWALEMEKQNEENKQRLKAKLKEISKPEVKKLTPPEVKEKLERETGLKISIKVMRGSMRGYVRFSPMRKKFFELDYWRGLTKEFSVFDSDLKPVFVASYNLCLYYGFEAENYKRKRKPRSTEPKLPDNIRGEYLRKHQRNENYFLGYTTNYGRKKGHSSHVKSAGWGVGPNIVYGIYELNPENVKRYAVFMQTLYLGDQTQIDKEEYLSKFEPKTINVLGLEIEKENQNQNFIVYQIHPLFGFGEVETVLKEFTPKSLISAVKNPWIYFGDGTSVKREQALDILHESLEESYLKDLDLAQCKNAYRNISHSSDKRGFQAVIGWHLHFVDAKQKLIKAGADEETVSIYREKALRLYKDWIYSKSSIASANITGPANFPAARMQKRWDADHNKNVKFSTLLEKFLKRIKKQNRAPITVNSELEKAKAELAKNERNLEQMKAINKIARSRKKNYTRDQRVLDIMEQFNITRSNAENIMTEDWNGAGFGFRSYALTNCRQRIERWKGRVKTLSQKVEAQDSGNKEEVINGYKVVHNFEVNRIQILFDGKPDLETRNKLKKKAFRWSPKFKAWQRQLTENAIHATNMLLNELPTNE